jgi:hypothetical protein
MSRLLVVVLAAVVPLLAPAAAHAAVKPLGIKSVSPQDGAVLVLPNQITFQVKTDQAMEPYGWIEIATQPTLGQDGTLAQEFTVASVYATRGDAFPDTYTGSTDPRASWQRTPGTYYFQLHFTHVDSAPAPVYAEVNTYVSPIYTLTIAAPPPPATPPAQPPPSPDGDDSDGHYFQGNSEAKRVLKGVLREAYGSRFTRRRAFRASCGLNSGQAKATCSVSWKHRTWRYKGTARMTALDDGSVRYRLNIRKQRTS